MKNICKHCGQEIKEQEFIKIGDLEWCTKDLSEEEMDWYKGMEESKKIGMRMPERKEWDDLFKNHFEEIKKLNLSGYYYWSATTLSDGTHYAWYVDLDGGYTVNLNKTITSRVRCVR